MADKVSSKQSSSLYKLSLITVIPLSLSLSSLLSFSVLTTPCLDPPNVTVTTTAEGPVVEGEDSVSLKCEVDANPEGEITWRKDGDRRVLGNFPVLDIGVVSRTDTGSYSCVATNELGESPPGYVDVETYCEYPPL